MVALATYDYEALAAQLGVPVKTIQAGFDSKKSLHGFNMVQLKSIIKYLKDKGERVNLTGTKGVLVDNIARVVWGESTTTPAKPSNQTIGSLLPVTIEHNSWQWNAPKQQAQVTFNDENFFGKQVPFFEHLSFLAVIPFLAREDMHPRGSFNIDEATCALVKEKKRAIHARFFSKERKGDIPWNIDVVLKINGTVVDIQKLARKIRSKAYKEPNILPRPADVSHTVRPNGNTLEFCHPGETGFLILHVVQEKDIEPLIAHVIADKKVSGSRANMKNDDIEEMNYMLSMKCPLSYMRIETPVRSKNCTHEQCFDLKSYMDYCYQQQIWHCPVCEIGAPYKDLIYDDNFKKILMNTTADKVTVQPDGSIVDADTEPTAKRQKLNTPSTPTPPPKTAISSSSSTVAPPNPPNPANIISLDLDSPPPSPLSTTTTTTTTSTTNTTTTTTPATPFVFAPPSTTPTISNLSVSVPPSLAHPVPPSVPPELPTSPVTPSPIQTSAPPPLAPSPLLSPSLAQPQATSTPQLSTSQNLAPPITQNGTPNSPATTTLLPNTPHVIDLKQEPGLIKKILQKLSPAITSTPAPPFSSPSSSSSSSSAITPPPATPTPVTPPPVSGGNTSTDAIVISDDDD